MQFKVKGINFNLSFSFLAVFLFYYLNNDLQIYLSALISVFVHECIHLLLIVICGGKISCIKLNIFGGNIQRDSSVILQDHSEALISIAAPLSNIIIFLLDFTMKREITNWGAVNLVLGAINILPFYDFDGGRFLYYILRNRCSEKSLFLFQFSISLFLTILLTGITITIIILYKSNYILIFFNLYVIFSLIFIKK